MGGAGLGPEKKAGLGSGVGLGLRQAGWKRVDSRMPGAASKVSCLKERRWGPKKD